MINIKPEIFALLKQIPNVEVVYFRPKTFTTLPLITYYETVNVQTAMTLSGTEERYSQLQFQIDIYTETSTQASDLAIQTDELLRSVGFTRGFTTDGYDFENSNYRRIMRYTGTIDNRNKTII